MPRLSSYRSAAPFTADELVESASALLRAKPGHDVTKRLLRYYISEGIVPPPRGSSRYARYDYEHLVALVTARAMLDQGMRLDRVRHELQDLPTGDISKLEAMGEAWLAPHVAEERAGFEIMVAEAPAFYSRMVPKKAPRRLPTEQVQRLRLTKSSVLEVSSEVDFDHELLQAWRRLSEIVER